jgi:methylmalonyl-CoA/ethylmalonyl-CoA epimerase
MGGASSWQDGLDRHGEGFHHIAFWTENAAEDAKGLAELGVDLFHRGDMGERGQFAYFDGESELKTTIELLENERTELSPKS